jgi:hypothetical protein
MTPKAFISYSWTSKLHQDTVRSWADRLLTDGVSVVLDQYDLKEGDDKYAFMEKMVTDPSVSHVLVMCDKAYAEKADARKAGVGTESQIISQEVYKKVEQSKFIPIFCELSEQGEPFLPTFMKSRIGINFSTPELVNENWEQLVRLLFGKPLYQKPAVGTPPTYISEDKPAITNPAVSRFASFKQALLQGRKGIGSYRSDFLAACFKFADELRVRQAPQGDNFGKQVLDSCGKLLPIRDLITDWVLLEANSSGDSQFEEALSKTLEDMLELRARPKEVTSWNDSWFEAHQLFTFETFLYIAAALLKCGAYEILHEIFSSSLLRPETETYGSTNRFVHFDCFLAFSATLNSVIAPEGRRLLSPAAELIKRQATRADLPFETIIEADLLALMAASISENARWFPQTIYYAGYGKTPPFFLRATQHKHFKKLAIITGIESAEELRTKVKAGIERMRLNQWPDYSMHANTSFSDALNLDKLDTIK